MNGTAEKQKLIKLISSLQAAAAELLVTAISELNCLVNSCRCSRGYSSPEPALVGVKISLNRWIPPGINNGPANNFRDCAWGCSAQRLSLEQKKANEMSDGNSCWLRKKTCLFLSQNQTPMYIIIVYCAVHTMDWRGIQCLLAYEQTYAGSRRFWHVRSSSSVFFGLLYVQQIMNDDCTKGFPSP